MHVRGIPNPVASGYNLRDGSLTAHTTLDVHVRCRTVSHRSSPPVEPPTMPVMKNRSTRFPNFNPGTTAGLLTWILIIALFLPLVRTFVALHWSPADIAFLGAAWLVATYGLVAITMPIVLKRSQWLAVDREYLPLDLDSLEAPDVFRSWAATVIPSMHDLGFEFRGHFRPTRAVPRADAFVTLFENRSTDQSAQLFTVTVKRGIFRRSETVLTFITEFADGTVLYTSNSRTPTILPPIRIREGSMSFPEIDNPARVYAIHQATLASFAGRVPRLGGVIDDPAEFLRKMYQKEVIRFADSGYYFLDAKSNIYRLTWRGADSLDVEESLADHADPCAASAQSSGAAAARARPGGIAGALPGSNGRRTTNVEPCPGSETNPSVPAKSSRICRLTNSPRPVPCGLVVKYG